MKVLYVIYPSMGIGEIYTCMKLAGQLERSGATGYFIGPEIIQAFEQVSPENHQLFSESLVQNKRIFDDAFSSFQPDLIVFTDYYMAIKKLQSNLPFDVDWLNKEDTPCMVIDTIGNCRLSTTDTAIYKSNQRYIVQLPGYVQGILHPAPPHDPRSFRVEDQVVYFPLFTDPEPVDEESHRQIRERFKIDLDKKIVIFPLGQWVEKVATGVEYQLYQVLLQIILRYLRMLDTEIDLYILGNHPFPNSVYQKVTVKTDLMKLPFLEGDQLIQSADLIITVNRFSNSLGRANHYQVPTLTFINSKDIEMKDGKIISELDYQMSPLNQKIIRTITNKNGMIRKFQIFPESKIEIIDEFVKHNPGFRQINPVCDLFNEKTAVQLLEGMLFEEKGKYQQAEREYMQAVYDLPIILDRIKELIAWNMQS